MRRTLALLKKTQLLLLACLFVMVAMIVFCALTLFFNSSLYIAQAEEESDAFVVKATNFDADTSMALWSITRGEDVVLEPTVGKWSTSDSTAISIKSRDVIREQLKKDGVVDKNYNGAVGGLCTILFDFGDVDATLDVANGVYKETNVSVRAYVGAITTYSADLNVYFEYKKEGKEDIKMVKAIPVAGGYALPNNLSYGNYSIRLFALYKFNFEEVKYTTYRYGEWMDCSIAKAKINLPEELPIHATYGTTLADMSNNLKEQANLQISGVFVPLDAENQSESVLKDVQDIGKTILTVKEGSYTVCFEFVPDDDSYERATVSAILTIDPQSISLMIRDAFSLEGTALVCPDYYLSNPGALVGNDTIDDLDISFDFIDIETLEKIDGSVAGKFKTVAVSGNANYIINGNSADTQFWDGGGRYWVYKEKLEYITEDDVKFYVYINADLVGNGSVRITKMNVDEPLKVEGKVFLCAYRITMFDAFNAEIEPDEDYKICWESNPYKAEWVSAYDGGFDFIKADADVGITLAHNQNLIYFFMDEEVVQKEQSMIGAYIAIGCSALLIGLIAVCLLFKRLFICKHSYENYVYEYENHAKSADCEKSTENIGQDNDAKTENKKQRHGKKNKQINGTKRG